MQIVIAQMKRERIVVAGTNPAEQYRGRATPPAGRDAYEAYGRRTAVAASSICPKEGANIEIPIAANAWPSRPGGKFGVRASRPAASPRSRCTRLRCRPTQPARRDGDGEPEDGEGELLTRLRRLAPHTPIGVALDMHANLYPAIVQNCDVLAGYQTYPHVDVYENGMRRAPSSRC